MSAWGRRLSPAEWDKTCPPLKEVVMDMKTFGEIPLRYLKRIQVTIKHKGVRKKLEGELSNLLWIEKEIREGNSGAKKAQWNNLYVSIPEVDLSKPTDSWPSMLRALDVWEIMVAVDGRFLPHIPEHLTYARSFVNPEVQQFSIRDTPDYFAEVVTLGPSTLSRSIPGLSNQILVVSVENQMLKAHLTVETLWHLDRGVVVHDFKFCPLIHSIESTKAATVGLEVHQAPTHSTRRSPTKTMVWNCRGAGNKNFRRNFGALVAAHNPSMVLLTETRISGIIVNDMIAMDDFKGSCAVDPIGHSGGIWLLWNTSEVQVKTIAVTDHGIHAIVQSLCRPPSMDSSDSASSRQPFDLNNDPSHDMDDDPDVSVHDENTMSANPEVPTFFVGTYYQIPDGRSAGTLTPGEVMAMTFPSYEVAFSFYKEYGYCKGFGVRRCEKKQTRGGVVNFRTIVCSREGFRPKKHLERVDNVRPQRAETRCGCLAKIRFGLSQPDGTWSVRAFDDAHNHNMISRALINQHRCFRNLSISDITQNTFLKKYRFRTSDVVGYLAEQNGGYHENRFLSKDVYNHDAAQRRLTARHGDVELAIAYLDAKKLANPTCYHMPTVDAEGRLENLFWADAGACLDYQYFGDVVSFDATYKTNMYALPFVVFVGNNNHGQTIFFGAAFMANESKESYVWLLQEFTKCHGGKQPMSVITDSDKAMRAAVRNVWPDSNHRLCEWHLEKNCQKLKNEKLNEAYMKLMRKRCTPTVFETGWRKLMDDFKDASNTGWALDAYEKRHMWARALLRGQFYAGMTTTQRSEGMNAFIKLFTTPNMNIRDTIEKFDFKLGSWRQKELTSEFRTRNSTPIARTCLYAIEKHAMAVYTNYSYLKFVNETLKFDQDNVIVPGELVRVGTGVMYQVKSLSTGHVYTVTVDGDLVSCSCNKFEEEGMPCSHIVTVTKVTGRDSIPLCCIMKRWTPHAMDNHERFVPNPVNTDREANSRYVALTTILHGSCQIASKHQPSFDYMKDGMTRLHSEMVGRQQNGDSDPSGVGQIRNVPTSERRAEIVLDPVSARARRHENGGKKKKHCTRCKQPGHNVTTCRLRLPDDNGTGDHTNGRNVRHPWDDQPHSYDYFHPQGASQMHYGSQQPGSSSRPHDNIPHGWQQPETVQAMWWQSPY